MNPDLDFIQVTSFNIFSVFIILLSLNLIVLITWTVVAPLEWTRVNESATDMFNRNTDSFGVCTSEDGVAFVVVLIVMNVGFFILANWAAYKARNIETEYNESRYIGISMAAVLQAWCMGIPILIVVWDNPQARFYVQAGIIFVTAQALVSLVYVPKMLALRQAQKKAKEELDPKQKAYSNYQRRISSSMGLDDGPSIEGNEFSNEVLISPLPMIGETIVPENPQDPSPLDDVGSAEMLESEQQGDLVRNGDQEFHESLHDQLPVQSADTTPRTSSGDSSTSTSRRERWHLFTGGAKSSKTVGGSERGIKVLHNPRVSASLVLRLHARKQRV